jgi:hypothetical protein
MTTELATPPFELSRAYANGWIAGKAYPIEDDDAAAAIDATAAPLNPCAASERVGRTGSRRRCSAARRALVARVVGGRPAPLENSLTGRRVGPLWPEFGDDGTLRTISMTGVQHSWTAG